MATKAQLEEKMRKMQEDIDKLTESNKKLTKTLEVKEKVNKNLDRELQDQSVTVRKLIGAGSDIHEEITALKKRNRELISENTFIKKQLTNANESLYTLVSKL